MIGQPVNQFAVTMVENLDEDNEFLTKSSLMRLHSTFKER
jgi:hypothetical protein